MAWTIEDTYTARTPIRDDYTTPDDASGPSDSIIAEAFADFKRVLGTVLPKFPDANEAFRIAMEEFIKNDLEEGEA